MPAGDGLTRAIRARARELGFDLVGCAHAEHFAHEQELILEDLGRGYLSGMSWITAERVALSCNPEELLPGARSILGLGMSYAQPEAPEAPHSRLVGRIARYAQGGDYHHVIRPKLEQLGQRLIELAGPGTRYRAFVDTGPLIDRAAAVRAGLGFIGKNTCVLTGRHGSYVFLSALISTAELVPDPLVTKDCGSCRACLDACPTGALVGPGEMDANLCISYLTIEHRGSIPAVLRPQMGDWLFGCDICQEVCPWNRARPPVAHPEFAPSGGAGATVDLAELLNLDEDAFRARFRGTPLTRPKRAGLLRNAAVVAGNSGDQRSVPALLRALTDGEWLVREHAAWALQRLSPLPIMAIEAIEAALEVEKQPAVRAEMQEALTASRAR